MYSQSKKVKASKVVTHLEALGRRSATSTLERLTARDYIASKGKSASLG